MNRFSNVRTPYRAMISILVWMGLLFLYSSRIIVADASAPVRLRFRQLRSWWPKRKPPRKSSRATSREAGAETTNPQRKSGKKAATTGVGEASETPKKFRFVHKTVILPHDSKKHRGGEDAASTTDDMLVVADGVGGWANQGVDPGLYSRKLVRTITSAFANMTALARDTVDLKRLVHESNLIAANAYIGSATCTVVRLKDASTLETVNVGDSGYSIHRRIDGGDVNGAEPGALEVAYASVPGQKAFNFPYQLGGRYGDDVYGPNVTDGPNTHALQERDVIVLVSDGVNDNMDPEEYHDCIKRYQWGDAIDSPAKAEFEAEYEGYFDDAELVSHSAAADCIARTAYFLGKDKTHDSPFARSAASYGRLWSGGKRDDITVVVAQVGPADVADTGREDPHRAESIFLYRESDYPVEGSDLLPTMDKILGGILARARPVAAEL